MEGDMKKDKKDATFVISGCFGMVFVVHAVTKFLELTQEAITLKED